MGVELRRPPLLPQEPYTRRKMERVKGVREAAGANRILRQTALSVRGGPVIDYPNILPLAVICSHSKANLAAGLLSGRYGLGLKNLSPKYIMGQTINPNGQRTRERERDSERADGGGK